MKSAENEKTLDNGGANRCETACGEPLKGNGKTNDGENRGEPLKGNGKTNGGTDGDGNGANRRKPTVENGKTSGGENRCETAGGDGDGENRREPTVENGNGGGEIFKIRKADARDAHGIFLVSEASIAGEERWSEKLFLDDLNDPDKHYFAAVLKEDETRVLGFIGAAHILDEAHIMDVAVLPAFRRMGIGGKLFEACLKSAAESDITAATLEVRVGNASAIALYRRCGFRFAGVRKRYYPDKEDAEIYWKEW